MGSIKINRNKTLLVSDGGNIVNEIDHTYLAFLAACNKDYDGILAHIRFTKDREIVCSRNRSLYKIIKRKIHISQHKYSDLLNYEYPNKYSFLTKLEELIELSVRYHQHLYLKLCQPIGCLEIDQLQKLLKKVNYVNISIIVNDYNILNSFKEIDRKLSLLYITDSIDDEIINICKANKFGIITSLNNNTLEYLKLAKENNIKFGVYNINNPIDASILIDNNVDILFTNHLE